MAQEIDHKLIVFESNPDFSDNSRGLWEYITHHTDYKTFWVVYEPRMLQVLSDHNIKCALINSDEAKEMAAKAQYLITSGFVFASEKKIGQIHVSLWHGFPLKLIGFFDSATNARENLSTIKFLTTPTDMISVTSRFSRLTVSGMFAVDPRKVKETGYPRNDIMLRSDAKKELQKLTATDIGSSKLFLYLPTMRKGLKEEGEQFSDNIFNYADYDAGQIDSFLEEQNAYIFAKVHFADNALYAKDHFQLPKRMFFLDSFDLTKHLLTIYHIMDAFDALITDYSSVYVDFMLLNKPIVFSCPDMEQFRKDRGFVIDDPKLLMPGAICQSQKQLLQNLREIIGGNDQFRSMREEKMPFFHSHRDGGASKRILNEMEQIYRSGAADASKEIAPYYFSDASPLFQYTGRGRAEIYIDYGEGFSEENKIIKQFDIFGKGNKVKYSIQYTSEMKGIRFDPENTGRWIFKNFKASFNGEDLPVTWMNCFTIKDDIIPENSDPGCYLDMTGKEAGDITVSYECFDFLAEAKRIVKELDGDLKDTEQNLEAIEQALEKMEHSYSWKVTRPLRAMKRTAKRLLKKCRGDSGE